MSEVWVLLWVDHDGVECLGVYSALAQAEAAQRVVWARYQALDTEARGLEGPQGLQHEPTLTWDTFVQWHPLLRYTLDVLPLLYAAPEGVGTVVQAEQQRVADTQEE